MSDQNYFSRFSCEVHINQGIKTKALQWTGIRSILRQWFKDKSETDLTKMKPSGLNPLNYIIT